MSSNVERTGLRDMKLSTHLREYGNCFVTDLDGLLLGFDYRTPVGLFEMKHMNLADVVWQSRRMQIKAQITLANNSSIGFYYTIYNPDRWIFNITPMNEFAMSDMDSRRTKIMSDDDFYRFQCQLRCKAPAREFSKDRGWVHPELQEFIEEVA